jgi:hypothetical protein
MSDAPPASAIWQAGKTSLQCKVGPGIHSFILRQTLLAGNDRMIPASLGDSLPTMAREIQERRLAENPIHAPANATVQADIQFEDTQVSR